MSVRDLVREIHRRDRVLSIVGWIHAGLFVLMALVLPFDDRRVLGISPWIKPMKFAASIAIYLWTIAWLLEHVRTGARLRRLISRGISAAMLTEIALITLQAARGTPSHFNVADPFDAIVFQIMGLMIVANTVLAGTLTVLAFVRMPDLPPLLRWGVRLGLVVFVMGSFEAVFMLTSAAHTVGAPDGGPGLPVVNWSTRAGDLRIAHLLGLHALQILPLGGWLAHRRLGERRGRALFAGFAALYVAAFGATLWLALAGRPLLAL